MSAFRYTHAVVSRIPKSFQTCSDGINIAISTELARQQLEVYVKCLRDIGLDVIELPPDENHPYGVFVEDLAVVCNGTAFLCRLKSVSRQKEVEYMRTILCNELELPVIEISDEKAFIDGGDVLFTGKEFFIGLTARTNEAGACALACAFPEFPCTPIKVDDSLYLKSFLTMAGPDLICVGSSKIAQDTLKRIEREATFRYQVLTIPNDFAANVVFANGLLLHRSLTDFPNSVKVFQEKLLHWDLRDIEWSEIAKVRDSLSCCSILIRKTKHIKSIM